MQKEAGLVLVDLSEDEGIKRREREIETGLKKKKKSEVAQLCPTPQTVAYQAPPSMGFSRPKYWSGLPFPSPGDLPDPGIKPWSPTL